MVQRKQKEAEFSCVLRLPSHVSSHESSWAAEEGWKERGIASSPRLGAETGAQQL